MTIQVKPQLGSGPLRTPVQVRYDVQPLTMINKSGTSAKTKTVYQYSIVKSAGFDQKGMPILIHVPISEGRFKKMKKQQQARTNRRVVVRNGYTNITL